MRRARRAKLNEILRKLRSADLDDVIEAGTSFYLYDDAPPGAVVKILEKNERAFNRQNAAYALISTLGELESKIVRKRGGVFHHDKYRNDLNRREIARIIKSLLRAIDADESPTVRAQALETLGRSGTAESERHRLRARIEKSVVAALSHETHEVRFWACYAAGELKIKRALPRLGELAETDTEDWGEWWLVSEEAADAIDWIHGRRTEPRIPVAQRGEIKS